MSVENKPSVEVDSFNSLEIFRGRRRFFNGLAGATRRTLSAAIIAGQAIIAPVSGAVVTGSEIIIRSGVVSPVVKIIGNALRFYQISPADEAAIAVGTAEGEIHENLPPRRSRRRQNRPDWMDDPLSPKTRDQFLNRRPPHLPHRR